MRKILIISIFILGAFLRFYNIEKCCLHGDGVLTAGVITESDSLAQTWSNVVDGFHGDLPAYYVILELWSRLTNESVFWLRVFSVLCGLLFILALYKLAGLLFDRRTALLSAYFTAISPLLVFYSRKVRYYSLASLLQLASLYFFIKVIEKKDYRSCFLYALFSAAGLYVNYSFFLFLVPQVLFLVIYRKKYGMGIRKWLLSIFLVFILWLPISGYFLRDFSLLMQAEGFVRTPLKFGWISSMLYFLFVFSLGVTVSPFNYPVAAAGAAVYSIILVKFIKSRLLVKNRQGSIVLIVITILAVSSLCAASGYNASRYIKAVSGLYAIAVAIGILSFRRRSVIIALILAITLLRAYSLSNLYAKKEYHRKEFSDSWDKISEYVDNNSDNKDVIIFNGLAFGYYLRGLNPVKSLHSMPEDEEGMRQFILENIEQPGAKRVILVDSPLSGLRMKDFEDEIALLKDHMSRNNYRLVSRECFDRDKRAVLRRKLVDRPFPECRTTVWVYSKQ